MATSAAPTVAVLKERLKEHGLPTAGRKAELLERLAAYYQVRKEAAAAEPVVPSASYQGMTRDIRREIGRVATGNLFYFCDQMELLKTLGDIQGLKEGIYPTTVDWTVMKHGRHTAYVTSIEDLKRVIGDILATQNVKDVTMKRGHLSVRVTFDTFGQCEVQILLKYPAAPQAAYEVEMRGAIPFVPQTQTKPFAFTRATCVRKFRSGQWTAQQTTVEDAKKAIKDLVLGMVWIHQYLMPKGATWNPLMTTEKDNLQFIIDPFGGDPLGLSRNKIVRNEMERFYIAHVKKAFPKPTTRRRAI